MDTEADEEAVSQWAAIERLPTVDRLKSCLFDENDEGKRVVDVSKLSASQKRMFIEKLIKHIEHDNLRLLQKIRKRMDMGGVGLPSIEVRYTNLRVEAECEVVYGKPLPTLWNSLRSMAWDAARVLGLHSREANISRAKVLHGQFQ